MDGEMNYGAVVPTLQLLLTLKAIKQEPSGMEPYPFH